MRGASQRALCIPTKLNLIIGPRASAQPNQTPHHPANRSKTDRDENITPCSYHNAAISQYPVSVMKHTYLCCKITAQLMYISTVRPTCPAFASLQIIPLHLLVLDFRNVTHWCSRLEAEAWSDQVFYMHLVSSRATWQPKTSNQL